MPRKPIELPPVVARGVVEHMQAFFAEKDPIKRDAIAAEQMTVLQKYQGPREMFLQMRDDI
jgi:hypothetical protein